MFRACETKLEKLLVKTRNNGRKVVGEKTQKRRKANGGISLMHPKSYAKYQKSTEKAAGNLLVSDMRNKTKKIIFSHTAATVLMVS